MQFDSFPPVFDSETFSTEHPLSPEGSLFSYYPELQPAAMHYHDFLELGYCEWGSGLFYVDGEAVPFTGPCCSILYPGQIHIAQSIGEEKSLWHFIYVDVKSLFPGAHLTMISGLKAMSSHLYDFPIVISMAQDPMMYRLCADVMKEAAELQEDYLTVVRGLVAALLGRHSRMMQPARTVRKLQEQNLLRLGTVLTYINQHYMEDVSIDMITAAVGASKSTLQRDMLEFTGMAPLQYIHYLRMKRAAVLLMQKTPVADVAFSVGYNTISSFNRHFLSEFGVSPTQWRKQHEQ